MLLLKTGPWVPEPHGEKSVTLGWSVWIWEDRIRMLWVPQNCPNVDSLSYCRAKAGASITKAVMPIGRDVGASYCWYLTLSLHDVAEVGLHGGRWNMVFIFMVSRRLENGIGSCTVQYLSIKGSVLWPCLGSASWFESVRNSECFDSLSEFIKQHGSVYAWKVIKNDASRFPMAKDFLYVRKHTHQDCENRWKK